MGKLGQVKTILSYIEDVGVDINIVYPEWIYCKDLLELDFCAPEI